MEIISSILLATTGIIITRYIMNNNTNNKIMYNKQCIEQCDKIIVPRCPYEACAANCKRTNCVSRCSDRENKPIINCTNHCKDYEKFRTNSC